MLTTEMWPIERLSHLYATESSQLSDDDLHPSSDERRPFRAATCSRPGFNKDLDSYWRGGDDDDYRRGGGDNDYRRGDDDDDYRRGDDDDYRRSCSMPSHERSNPDVDPSRYDDRYYDVSMKHLHPRSNRLDEYGLAGRPFDASNRNVGNDVEGSKPVDGSRGSRPYQNKSMSKTDDSYSGEKRGEDAYRRRNELSHSGDFQGQSSDRVHHLHHPKGHLRDFSESRAISPDLSFGYKVKNVTKPRCPSPHPERSHTRYEGHKMDPRANPRRFASGMDDNPIMVHQYKKSQTCTQSRNDDPNDDRFPTPTNSDQFVVIDDDDDDGGGGDDYDYGGGDDDETKKYHNLRPYRSNKKEIDVEHQQSSDTWARFASQRRSSNETNKEVSSMLPPHLNDSTSEEVGGGGTSAHPTNESSTDNNKTSRSSQKVALARSHVPKKHSSKDVCVICGDKASGYHYNTLSCEGCKGFFRRTITRGLHYQCKYGGDCVMDTWMRRKCPACRLKRCKQVGMREECLLTEHQCVIRNSRRRMKIKMKKEEESDNLPSKEAAIGGGDMSADDTQAILASLNSDHRDLIERLVNLQDKYEIPSPDDLKLLKEDKMYNASSQDDLSDAIFVHMVEMTILVTRLIVEFAKHLPGFRNLLKEDQIVLLKSSSSEVMMLRTARRYNADSNTIVFGNGVPFSPSSMAFGGLQESVESLFTFSKSMSCLYVDNAEYALLTAMCIFSIRSGLTNPSVVDKLQEVYMEVLLAYISKRRTKCQNYLAKLLMKFVNLRTLGHEHSQTLYNLTLKKGSLPPLLTEYFDISE